MYPLFSKLFVLALFLIAHGLASWKRWYYTRPQVDMITHFLGGLALSAFLKDRIAAVTIIFAWEVMEMILIRRNRIEFRERPLNKMRDLLFGLLGYFIGVDML